MSSGRAPAEARRRLRRMRQALDDAATLWRYVVGLRGFLRTPLDLDAARRQIAYAIETRPEQLLSIVGRAVYDRPQSPYLRLLEHAGVERADFEALVGEEGVEGALARLYDAGVYVTVDELKGKRPIRRGSLSLDVTPRDFDNPLLVKQYEASTGGSGGAARSLVGNFDTIADTAHVWVPYDLAFPIRDRRRAVWFPMPPSLGGMMTALIFAKLGLELDRWFSQTRVDLSARSARAVAVVGAAWSASRVWGERLPFPEYTPPEEAVRVARWCAEQRSAGGAAYLVATPSSCVRVCSAAAEHDLDIAGTLFSMGGEPFTEAKAAAIRAAGCTAISSYGMSELGALGVPCAQPEEWDEVHVAVDRVAVLERPRELSGEASVDAMFLTGLNPTSPKLMLNADSGDYGVLAERDCGCPLHAFGYPLHLHTIRSYEKLTSEGMTFVGPDLIRLVEDYLPSRFGGGPHDYQLVEEEREGATKVRLLVSPQLGPLDEGDVADQALRFLGSGGRPEAMMADVWRGAGALEVVRREPHVTAASKVMPLHVVRAERAYAGGASTSTSERPAVASSSNT